MKKTTAGHECPATTTTVTVAPLPDAFHEQVEYEVACAYAQGLRDGYRAAEREFAREWARNAGVEPHTQEAVIRRLVWSLNQQGRSA